MYKKVNTVEGLIRISDFVFSLGTVSGDSKLDILLYLFKLICKFILFLIIVNIFLAIQFILKFSGDISIVIMTGTGIDLDRIVKKFRDTPVFKFFKIIYYASILSSFILYDFTLFTCNKVCSVSYSLYKYSGLDKYI